jgi:hypothetical protein
MEHELRSDRAVTHAGVDASNILKYAKCRKYTPSLFTQTNVKIEKLTREKATTDPARNQTDLR